MWRSSGVGACSTREGESFMEKYHPDANAAEIHELTRAMVREAEKGNGPPFYIEMGDAWKTRIGPALAGIGGFMPINLAKLEAEGIDLAQRQEWVPAVQTLRGGVRIEPDGQSDLPGLFAAGMTEALDPGLFNGWSTMRAMGSGERSGRGAAAYLRERCTGFTRRRPDRRAGGACDGAAGAEGGRCAAPRSRSSSACMR